MGSVPGVEGVVRSCLEGYDLELPGEAIVVGVSGGPDSLCLLHVLHALKADYRFDLHVAHLHHGIRGDDADADADAVRAIAAEWNLPCSVELVDVPELSRKHRMAIEETARQARYSFLGRVAEATGSRLIAVGHNADDQVETVLMHWIRGAGLAGLRGMLPVTSLAEYRMLGALNCGPVDSDIRLVRPLLAVPRSEIEAYCVYHRLEPRFDRSNLDTTLFRNWLRHEVLPMLARHNPNIRNVIRSSSRVLADDYEMLRSVLLETWNRLVREETAERITLDLDGWRALPTSLQRATVREAVQRLRRSLRDLSFVHVENAVAVARSGSAGAQCTLPRGLVLTVEYELLVLGSMGVAPMLPDWPLLVEGCGALSLRVPGTTALPGSGWELEVQVLSRSALPRDWESNKERWRAFVDAREVGSQLWLRARRPGDRFQPLGMSGRTVKLSGFFTNRKVQRAVRDRLPVVVSDRGIAWVCGFHLDDAAAIRESTREVLYLRFVRQDSC